MFHLSTGLSEDTTTLRGAVQCEDLFTRARSKLGLQTRTHVQHLCFHSATSQARGHPRNKTGRVGREK